MIATKLGWKPGLASLVIGAPSGVDLGLPAENGPDPDVILAFVPDAASLPLRLEAALPHYQRSARLWFAYPKKSGRLASDIDRDHGWDAVAAHGLLPVTQIAIDADWSALRFRYRDEIAKLTRKG